MDGRFATAILMTYYAPSGHLVMVNAGHPPPLLKRSGSPVWEALTSESHGAISQTSREVRVGLMNLPLGVISSTQYEQYAIKINPGDRLCAFTDAYSEAANSEGRMLGLEGLARMLSADHLIDLSIDELATQLQAEMQRQGYERTDDDHTMLLLEHNGQERPRLTIPIVGNWLKNNFGLGHTDTVPAPQELG